MARLPFVVVRTRSSDETRSLGERVGRLVRPGEVLLLQGNLGTGKTTFVQGLARGLEIPRDMRSPTFTMVHPHEGGRYPLLHIDLYRCENPGDVRDLGLEDLIEPPWVIAIEWGEKAFPLVPDDYLEIEFTWDDVEEDTRTVAMRPFGRWRERMRDLGDAVQDWLGENGGS